MQLALTVADGKAVPGAAHDGGAWRRVWVFEDRQTLASFYLAEGLEGERNQLIHQSN